MQVYKAIKGGIAEVAVKVMGHAGAGGGTARQAERLLQDQEAFRREILLLKSCRDRHIVQFLGACLQVGTGALLCSLAHEGCQCRACQGWLSSQLYPMAPCVSMAVLWPVGYGIMQVALGLARNVSSRSDSSYCQGPGLSSTVHRLCALLGSCLMHDCLLHFSLIYSLVCSLRG